MAESPSRSNTFSGQRQASLRDKTSYGIQPSNHSPTELSPSLAQSTSNSASNSSSSPPEPYTPPPRLSGSRTRYPDLGRVPLHRRGTSKTYERLEDLLKEAGYKETRIFTPETERSDRGGGDDAARSGDDSRTSVVKDGMDAVVGFFAGLLPSAAASKTNLTTSGEGGNELTTSPQEYSPPGSPLAQRQSLRHGARLSLDLTEPPTPSAMTSSADSLGDPTPKFTRQSSLRFNSKPGQTVNYSQPHLSHPQPPHHQSSLIPRNPVQAAIRREPSRSSVSRSNQHLVDESVINNNIVASPRPSRAGAYLRHMASTQSMPARPSSTPPAHPISHKNRNRTTMGAYHLNDSDSEGPPGSTYTRRRSGDKEKGHAHGHGEPPLPPSWLETVARAVLFGGTGAYIGGPAPDPAKSSSTVVTSVRAQVLRPTRSSLSQASSHRGKRSYTSAATRSGLSDHTNFTVSVENGLLVPPPPLFSMIERGRSGRSEGEVTMTRVLCRSAPGSRSGSVIRGGGGGSGEGTKEMWGMGPKRGRTGRRRKEDGDHRLPSLARTHAEGDVWSRSARARHGHSRGAGGVYNESGSTTGSRYLSGWGADVESEGDLNHEGMGHSSEEDEEDDGELDLARMLVPPKRQNSIKSLRRHLASDGPPSGAHATLKSIAVGIMPGSRAGRGMNVVNSGTPSLLRRRATEDDWDGECPEEWGGGWVKRGKGSTGSEDDDVESFVGFLGEGRGKAASGKGRLGFASPWGGGGF